jgi:nitrile hydratase subunit alpha
MSTSAPHGSHMQDFEAHVRAVESDLEYFRTKRLEPRLLYLMRRGLLPVYDLLRAAEGVGRPRPAVQERSATEARIRRLEDELDAFIRATATISITALERGRVVIEDVRTERGDYDDFFRLAKRAHEGSLEQRIEQLEQELDECMHLIDVMTRALLTIGAVTEEQLRTQRNSIEQQGYRNGARIVARAWADPRFKDRLIATGREAVRELDIPPGRLGKLGVAENTDEVHHVVVCTLCSCYPHDLLGNPPWWYRTDEYKQRLVEDPRETLKDMFSLELPETTRVTVHDSTSDIRWMVLPKRPAGTEDMSEEQLAELVTPECLVGTAHALSPPATAAS